MTGTRRNRAIRPTATAGVPARTRLLAALALAAATSATMAACSSSAPHPAAAASSPVSALSQDCTAVSDVLADGPDPTADPVGYAQAQILPLKRLALTDAAVRSAVSRLDAAFSTFVGAAGSAQAQDATKVTNAQNAVNALCPGAAS